MSASSDGMTTNRPYLLRALYEWITDKKGSYLKANMNDMAVSIINSYEEIVGELSLPVTEQLAETILS